MTSELRLEGGEGLSQAESWEKSVTEGKACAKALQQDPAWCNEGSAGRPVQGGKGRKWV